MFGYLTIDRQKLNDGQKGLWQTFMCGLCVSTKNLVGNVSRMAVNNDINTFNVLFHSVQNKDVAVLQQRCVAHPLKKRSILQTDEITDKLAIANVLLIRWNLFDDVIDDGKTKKKIALNLLSSAYKKSKGLCQKLDETIEVRYDELRTLEKSNCNIIDLVAHPFASLTQDFCIFALGDHSNPFAETLCYNLGKWIYLADALDDAKDDIARGNYNPLVSHYGAKSVDELVNNIDEINFLMFSTLNRIAQSFNDLNLTKYRCLLTNILFDSLRGQTTQLIEKLKQYKRSAK